MVKNYTQYFFLGMFVLILFLSYLLLKPYLTAILTACVLAFLFYPVNKVLQPLIKNATLRTIIVLLMLFVVIIVPVGLLANVLIKEIIAAYQTFSFIEISNFVTETLGISLSASIQEYLLSGIETALANLLNMASAFLWSLPQKIISMIIILFVSFFAIRDGPALIKTFSKNIPLENKKIQKILKKTSDTLDSLIHGVMAIAIIEGAVATIGFFIFGVKLPLFWGAIVAVFAMLPVLGPAVIYIPLALMKIFQNELWQGIGLLLYGIILLSLILDILIKTKLLGLKGKIHPLIILLGVFGGLQLFGMAGLLIGPVLLTILILFFEFYIKEAK